MLLVIPLYFLIGRRPRYGAAYLGVTAAWLALGLAALHAVHGDYMAPYPQLLGLQGGLNSGTLSKAAIGLGQSWLSGNFLLGFEVFRSWLVGAFPYRMLAEEIYLGRQLHAMEVWTAVATFFAAILLAGFSILLGLRLRRSSSSVEGGTTTLKDGRRAFVGVAAWAVVYIGSILWLQPENAGVWAFGLAPIWLAFCGMVIVPLARHRTLWPILALILAVGVHNYHGGIRMLRSSHGDLYVATSEWMLARRRPEDGILLRRWTQFAYWMGLRFPGAVGVVEAWKDPPSDWSRLKLRHPRIWAWGVHPDRRGLDGYPLLTDERTELELTLRMMDREFRQVQSGERGAVYLWEAPSSE